MEKVEFVHGDIFQRNLLYRKSSVLVLKMATRAWFQNSKCSQNVEVKTIFFQESDQGLSRLYSSLIKKCWHLQKLFILNLTFNRDIPF